MIDDLKVAISENDSKKAREILVNEILGTNYPYEVFTNSIALAEECNIFEEHNNEELVSDPKFWTNEYLAKLLEGLNENFSKERFLKAYYVTRKLEKEVSNTNGCCCVKGEKDYKDFFKLAKVSAAVVGITAIGIGIWCYNRKRK